MAALSIYVATLAGAVTPPIAAAAGGDSVPGDGVTRVLVNNPTGAAITVTFEAPGTDNFGVAHATAFDASVSVAAGQTRLFGPFQVSRFNDATQRVQMTYSAAGLMLTPL